MEQQIFQWVAHYGYGAIFALLVLGIVGLPVPDETLLTFTGYLVFTDRLHLVPAFLAAFLGSACGITLSYILGRTFGSALLHRYGRYLHLTPERISQAHNWFEHAGRWGLTFGYYVPGVRHLTAYAAGMSELEPHVFAVFAYSGACIWAASFIALGYFLGERWKTVTEQIERHAVLAAAGLTVLVLIALAIRRRARRG